MPDSTEFKMKDALTKIEEYKNYLAEINPKKPNELEDLESKKQEELKKFMKKKNVFQKD